jgi:hypothetical protein
MATIRVRDWTKEQIEKIRDEESHSSHDSVIKGLLKDRELAKFAGTPAAETRDRAEPEHRQPVDKEFDDLTVLAELEHADNGVVFLWCPSCGNEIAHVGFEDKNSMSIFEVECQRCLTRLDQRAVVSIEVGYPIEERVVEETVEDDLKECVIDYWNRSLAAVPAGSLDDEDIDEERLVWQYNEYVQEFGWTWPADVPVVGIRPGETYRNDATGDHFEVLEAVTDNRGTLDDYRIRRHDEQVDVLEADELLNLVLGRSLYLTDEHTDAADFSAAAE